MDEIDALGTCDTCGKELIHFKHPGPLFKVAYACGRCDREFRFDPYWRHWCMVCRYCGQSKS